MRRTATIKGANVPSCLLYLRPSQLGAITLNFVTFIFQIYISAFRYSISLDYFCFDISLFESLDSRQFVFVVDYVISKILSFPHRATLESES